MARVSLRERIKQDLFLLDGAMGTELIAREIEVGKCNDYLNIELPDVVSDIHRSYFEAGSDAVITNTFGANKYALRRLGFAEEVVKINKSGAQIARSAAGKEKYVLGDIGPSGDFLEPLGALNAEDMKEAFIRQANALFDGGVDGFIIETMTAIEEAAVAIEAVKSISGDLPVFASMSFDKAGDDFKTMMGVDVNAAVEKIVSLGVDSVGFNCGSISLEGYIELTEKFVSAVRAMSANVIIFTEPNAGKPELVDNQAVYKVSPEDFAAAIEKIYTAGVNVVGGCCGTGPAHIRATAEKLKS
jgi:5-methyltetrahydrofolate--homocysteine methyltransferase